MSAPPRSPGSKMDTVAFCQECAWRAVGPDAFQESVAHAIATGHTVKSDVHIHPRGPFEPEDDA